MMLPLPLMPENLFLDLIFKASLVLIFLSLLGLFFLAAAHFFSSLLEKKDAERSKTLSRYFYIFLSSPVGITRTDLPLLRGRDHDIACRIAIDFLRTVKGSDAERIIKLLEIWDVLPHLLNALKRSGKGEKIRILTLLSFFRDKKSLQTLHAAAASEETYVQLTALRGLAVREDIGYIGNVVRHLQKAHTTNKWMLADVLERFGEPAVPALLDLLSSPAPRDVRLAVLLALGKIKSLSSVPSLMKELSDPDESIRAQTILTLGKIGDISAGQALIGPLSDENASVRTQSAQALGLLRVNEALPQLAERLDDENWWVRFRAAEALHRLGDNGIALLKAVSSEQSRKGMIAAQVLAEKGASA